MVQTNPQPLRTDPGRPALADLPWGEHALTIKLGVRRMFCDNALCKRRVFTERLPGVAASWAKVSKVPPAKPVG